MSDALFRATLEGALWKASAVTYNVYQSPNFKLFCHLLNEEAVLKSLLISLKVLKYLEIKGVAKITYVHIKAPFIWWHDLRLRF